MRGLLTRQSVDVFASSTRWSQRGKVLFIFLWTLLVQMDFSGTIGKVLCQGKESSMTEGHLGRRFSTFLQQGRKKLKETKRNKTQEAKPTLLLELFTTRAINLSPITVIRST